MLRRAPAKTSVRPVQFGNSLTGPCHYPYSSKFLCSHKPGHPILALFATLTIPHALQSAKQVSGLANLALNIQYDSVAYIFPDSFRGTDINIVTSGDLAVEFVISSILEYQKYLGMRRAVPFGDDHSLYAFSH